MYGNLRSQNASQIKSDRLELHMQIECNSCQSAFVSSDWILIIVTGTLF